MLKNDLVPVNLFEATCPVQVDLVYAQPDHKDNLFPDLYHPKASILWAHKDLAAVTLAAAKLCNNLYGWTFKLNDCFRPVEAQESMESYNFHPSLVSRPGSGAHPRAMAIDIEPLDDKGVPIDMGTAFDFFVEDPTTQDNPAARNFTKFDVPPEKSMEIFNHRQQLEASMRTAASYLGFAIHPLEQEWWDFRFYESVYTAYSPLREKDVYPWQRLIEPDLDGAAAIMGGQVPDEISSAVTDVENMLERFSGYNP